jgi:hypothetical protein
LLCSHYFPHPTIFLESWKSHGFLFCKIKAFKSHGKLYFIEKSLNSHGKLLSKCIWCIFCINIRPKKNMCVYGHPTDSNFCWQPYEFLHRIRITIFVVSLQSNDLFQWTRTKNPAIKVVGQVQRGHFIANFLAMK